MTHWEWLMEISSSWSGGKVGILGQEEASFLQMNCQSPTDYAAACESFAPNSSSATLVPLFLLCPLGTPFSSSPCLIRALCCLFLLLTQKHLKPTPTLWSHKGGGWGVAPVEFHRWISHLVSSLQKLKRGCKCSFTKAFSRLLTWQRMPSLLLKVSNPSLPLHTLAALCLPKSQSPPISLSLYRSTRGASKQMLGPVPSAARIPQLMLSTGPHSYSIQDGKASLVLMV